MEGGGVHNCIPCERMEYDHRFSASSSPTPPLKAKHHHLCFTSCFRGVAGGDAGDLETPYGERAARPLIRSPKSWIRSKAHELPENCCKCRALVSHCRWGRHRRHHSADFRYDPLSYALNFDEGPQDECPASAEQLRYRCFSSRLPASPPRRSDGGGFDDRKRAHGVEGIEGPL
ncbi:hypothetical protein BHE74_00001116 [Ensete ventricosum]|nr:hypothetical protein GW17_00001641 [Ensete ventricosum]RWW89846.1 hypothetical protein BHE74_00001116 [Ensete ventricosum]RZR78890.1 hypothetical protein BHM03_00004451 [Ensete ventricosum]